MPAVLSLTTSPFVLVASQTLSLLWLRPIYFLLAALAKYLDSMQQALAVVLVLISLKIFAEALGFDVPIGAFLGIVAAWRVAVVVHALYTKRGRASHAAPARSALGADDDDTAIASDDATPLHRSRWASA